MLKKYLYSIIPAGVTVVVALLYILGTILGFLPAGLVVALRILFYVLFVGDVAVAIWRQGWEIGGFLLSIFAFITAFISGFGLEEFKTGPYFAMLIAILAIAAALLGQSSVETVPWMFISTMAISVIVLICVFICTIVTVQDGEVSNHIQMSPFTDSLFGRFFATLE